jgi:hypothetical protein
LIKFSLFIGMVALHHVDELAYVFIPLLSRLKHEQGKKYQLTPLFSKTPSDLNNNRFLPPYNEYMRVTQKDLERERKEHCGWLGD